MKITILREALLKSVSLVGQVVSPRPNLPILGNFLLEGKTGHLQMTATNLETTIEQHLPVKIEGETKLCVPARILIDLCQAATGEKLILEAEKENLRIKTGTTEASIPTISSSEFPSLSNFVIDNTLTIDKNLWLEAVSSVAFCATPEGGRPILSGVLLKVGDSTANLVATDGYRLAKKEMKMKGSAQAVIPARSLTESNKALEAQEDESLEVSTDKDKNQVRLKTKDLTVTTRLLEGEYPNYEQIVPTTFVGQFSCVTKELMDAIKLTSLFAREVGNVVRLEVGDKNLKVGASTAQVGEAQTNVQVSSEGEKINIAFNSRFLLEALAALKSKEALLSFSGTTSASLIRGPEDKSIVYLVMPVRVQS